MTRLGILTATTALALSLAAPRADAQLSPSSGGSNEMRAEFLFRSGEKKFDSGRHAEACADFAESLRLGPKLGTLLNLALCHETIGKTATAWSEYHHGAAWAAQNGQRDRHDFALGHAVALETKLPRVLLQLPSDGAIAAVDIDGEPLADSRWYLPVFLDPGEHSVTLSAPGKERSTVKFRVIASPTEQLVAVPALHDAGPPASVAPASALPDGAADPDRGRRLVGYGMLGVGAAGIALGFTFGLLAVSKRDEIGSRCVSNHCTAEGADLYRSSQRNAAVATWSSVIGVGVGAVGGWLLLTSQRPAKAPKVGLTPLGVAGVF